LYSAGTIQQKRVKNRFYFELCEFIRAFMRLFVASRGITLRFEGKRLLVMGATASEWEPGPLLFMHGKRYAEVHFIFR
jgi:hypothetical protein